jgi:hypothetical protein
MYESNILIEGSKGADGVVSCGWSFAFAFAMLIDRWAKPTLQNSAGYSGWIGKTLGKLSVSTRSDQENPGFRNAGFAIGNPFKPPIFPEGHPSVSKNTNCECLRVPASVNAGPNSFAGIREQERLIFRSMEDGPLNPAIRTLLSSIDLDTASSCPGRSTGRGKGFPGSS